MRIRTLVSLVFDQLDFYGCILLLCRLVGLQICTIPKVQSPEQSFIPMSNFYKNGTLVRFVKVITYVAMMSPVTKSIVLKFVTFRALELYSFHG